MIFIIYNIENIKKGLSKIEDLKGDIYMEKKNLIKRSAFIYSQRRENSNKYYIIEFFGNSNCNEYEVIVKYGRLGKNPTISKKMFDSEYMADKFYKGKISDKIKKGYEEVALEDIMFNEGEFYN